MFEFWQELTEMLKYSHWNVELCGAGWRTEVDGDREADVRRDLAEDHDEARARARLARDVRVGVAAQARVDDRVVGRGGEPALEAERAHRDLRVQKASFPSENMQVSARRFWMLSETLESI